MVREFICQHKDDDLHTPACCGGHNEMWETGYIRTHDHEWPDGGGHSFYFFEELESGAGSVVDDIDIDYEGSLMEGDVYSAQLAMQEEYDDAESFL